MSGGQPGFLWSPRSVWSWRLASRRGWGSGAGWLAAGKPPHPDTLRSQAGASGRPTSTRWAGMGQDRLTLGEVAKRRAKEEAESRARVRTSLQLRPGLLKRAPGNGGPGWDFHFRLANGTHVVLSKGEPSPAEKWGHQLPPWHSALLPQFTRLHCKRRGSSGADPVSVLILLWRLTANN